MKKIIFIIIILTLASMVMASSDLLSADNKGEITSGNYKIEYPLEWSVEE